MHMLLLFIERVGKGQENFPGYFKYKYISIDFERFHYLVQLRPFTIRVTVHFVMG